jgi:hypothetical protein
MGVHHEPRNSSYESEDLYTGIPRSTDGDITNYQSGGTHGLGVMDDNKPKAL